jgi:hypothetical protein
MTTRRARIQVAACVVTALSLMFTSVVSGEDSLAAARDLYASAAYDDALKMLDGLATRTTGADRDMTQLYRVMCLVALGRKADADRAVQSLVSGNPLFRPPAGDLSPRVLTAIRDARRKMLPTAIQQKYTSSKAAFDRKEYADSARGFKEVLDILHDPDVVDGGESPLADIRTLATGFLDLSIKASTPPPLPSANAAPAIALIPPPAAAGTPEARKVAGDVDRVYSSEDPKVVPPVVVRQEIPQFRGTISSSARGVVEVVIDENGAVASAQMTVPLSPLYNEFALSAVKTWRYHPATLNGAPVKFRKVVQINLTTGRP